MSTSSNASVDAPVLELNLSLIECFRANGPRQTLRCAVSWNEGPDTCQHTLPETGGWTLSTGQRLPLHVALFAAPVSQPLDLEVIFYEADETGLLPAPNDQLGSFGLRLSPDRSLRWMPGLRAALLGRLPDGRQLVQILGAQADYQLTFFVYEKRPL